MRQNEPDLKLEYVFCDTGEELRVTYEYLERMETFLHAEHPEYERFSALTATEEELGLLSRPDIGTKKKWLALLEERGLLPSASLRDPHSQKLF